MAQIELKPLEVIEDEIAAPVNADMVLEDLAIDSLEYICMLRRLEETFSIRIEEEDLKDVKTIGDLCGLVNRMRSA